MRYGVLLTFLLSAPGLQAQSRRVEFLNVKSWRGTFDMALDRADTTNGVKWSIQGTASGVLQYDVSDLGNSPPNWKGTVVSSTVNIRADLAYTNGDCSYTGVLLASGPLEPTRGTETQLRVFINSWDLKLYRQIVKSTYTRKTTCPNGFTTTQTTDFSTMVPGFDPLEWPYPSQGFTLDGKGKSIADNTGITDSKTPIPLQATYWDVHCHLDAVLDDLKLEVSSSEYEDWRPTAAPGPKAGKPLEFTASVLWTSQSPPEASSLGQESELE